MRKILTCLLLLIVLAGCGESPPDDAYLIAEAGKALGFESSAKKYAGKAAIAQFTDKERFSCNANGYKVTDHSIPEIAIIKRGKVIKSERGVSQKFMTRITGTATVAFTYTPTANWADNEKRSKTTDFAQEQEFLAYTDDYGEWKVRKQ